MKQFKTKPIHFDSNATTPLSPGVLKVILNAMEHISGNPSSITTSGRAARTKVVEARTSIAKFLGAGKEEIFFTSGGTESIQSLIFGIIKKGAGPTLSTSIEHSAVLKALENYETIHLDTTKKEVYDLEEIERRAKKGLSAMVFSLVNGEVGTILPLEEIANIAKKYDIPLIIDGVAALGKMPICLYEGITAMAFSGHKCHGPKGSGFCYLKKGTSFSPLLSGGKQEMGLRGGTENVPAILGLAQAVKEIDPANYEKLQLLRDSFERKIQEVFPNCIIHKRGPRISNVSNIHFPDEDGDHLLIYLDNKGISASLGSACSSGTLAPSHVLLGLGYSSKHALSSLRFSFHKYNTQEEIVQTIQVLKNYDFILS
ncbi:cysteine desulfurase [bacterium]|nr:cysteine desulfurase [bacterium]